MLELKFSNVKKDGKKADGDVPGNESKRNPLAVKAVLVGALAAGAMACTPNITIENIYEFPDGSVSTECHSVASCNQRTVDLRENGSEAGPDSIGIDQATLTLTAVVDVDGTKAATLELSGCGLKATATLKSGGKSALTVGNDSVEVSVDEIGYDSSGLKVKVTATPVCVPIDAGPDASTESDGGQGGADAGVPDGGDAG